MKIIKIEGFKGILTALFIGVCLFAGFVIFPGFVAMFLWNKYLVAFPNLSILQGVLLWGITFVSYCILTKNNFAVSFKSTVHELSDSELNTIMKNAGVFQNIHKLNKDGNFYNTNPYENKTEKKDDDNKSNIN